MSPVTEALRTILPVGLMLFLGAVCRRKQLISREGIQALKTVAVQIALPAVLLHTFAVTQYSLRDVIIPLMMFSETKPEDLDTDLEDHVADEWRYMCMARPVQPLRQVEHKNRLYYSDPLDMLKRR